MLENLSHIYVYYSYFLSTLSREMVTDGPSDFILSEPPSLSPIDRLNNVFQSLIENPVFKRVWDEVNSNLHKPINLIPANPDVPRGLLIVERCPVKCSAKEEKKSYCHKATIMVNCEERRTLSELARTTIFEVCNLKQTPQHRKITAKALAGGYAADYPSLEEQQEAFGKDREQVEFEAMQEAIRLARQISPNIYPNQPYKDFMVHYNHQKSIGHTAFYYQQYNNLMARKENKRAPLGSPNPPASPNPTPPGSPNPQTNCSQLAFLITPYPCKNSIIFPLLIFLSIQLFTSKSESIESLSPLVKR